MRLDAQLPKQRDEVRIIALVEYDEPGVDGETHAVIVNRQGVRVAAGARLLS